MCTMKRGNTYNSITLERMSLGGPEGEFHSQRNDTLRSLTQKIDISNSNMEHLDTLPTKQKHVWDLWAPSRLKPRTKISWLRSILYPNKSRPFPWRLMILNAIWTTLIVVLIEIPGTHSENIISFLDRNSSDIATFVSLCTFFLTIIISFRVNQAYSRWWEARTLWGSMTNDCRDLSTKALVHVKDHNLAVKICVWTSIAADLLRLHLRGKRELGLMEVMKSEINAISRADVALVEKANHRVLIVFWKITKLLAEAKRNNFISPLIHLHMNEHVQKFNGYMGAMERILRCPMPIGYTCIIRTAIVGWMAIFPFSLMPVFGYFSIPIDMIITYFICGLEETAAELENPFGSDPNDLPLEFFTCTIRNNIFELLSTYSQVSYHPSDYADFPSGSKEMEEVEIDIDTHHND